METERTQREALDRRSRFLCPGNKTSLAISSVVGEMIQEMRDISEN